MEQKILPLGDIYWGPSYSDDEVRSKLDNYQRRPELRIEYHGGDINTEVAQCLAANKVVARFAGREEMGARSLGNRAILATQLALMS